MPIEAYRGSDEAKYELFRISRLMWNTERIQTDLVRGMFIMIHKKGSRDDYGNYRAICLLCHSYKLMSSVVARRLMAKLEDHLPDTQAGLRPARGFRDNVCALKWFIQMVLREGRRAVITFIYLYKVSFRQSVDIDILAAYVMHFIAPCPRLHSLWK